MSQQAQTRRKLGSIITILFTATLCLMALRFCGAGNHLAIAALAPVIVLCAKRQKAPLRAYQDQSLQWW